MYPSPADSTIILLKSLFAIGEKIQFDKHWPKEKGLRDQPDLPLQSYYLLQLLCKSRFILIFNRTNLNVCQQIKLFFGSCLNGQSGRRQHLPFTGDHQHDCCCRCCGVCARISSGLSRSLAFGECTFFAGLGECTFFAGLGKCCCLANKWL